MSLTTDVNYAHTVARLAGVDVEHLIGLDTLALDVLYFGILADDAPYGFQDSISRIPTDALEIHRDNPLACPTPAHRAACDLVLARRRNAARRANR